MQAVLEGPYREAQEAPLNPLELRCREQTVADEIHCFVIDIIVGLLSQFGEKVNNQELDFVGVQKTEQNWTDKSNHN